MNLSLNLIREASVMAVFIYRLLLTNTRKWPVSVRTGRLDKSRETAFGIFFWRCKMGKEELLLRNDYDFAVIADKLRFVGSSLFETPDQISTRDIIAAGQIVFELGHDLKTLITNEK